jgi:hypothetical protein
MPLQNRVTPFGDLIAVPERGLLYGNRGCLHDSYGNIRRHHNGRRWIACRLSFRGRHRSPLLQPGRYTELFFLDEATALAAGHRPCAECRRVDFDRFVQLWSARHPGETGADVIDRRLHAERLQPDGRHQRRHLILAGDLPDGAMIIEQGEPWLVCGDELGRWTPSGYSDRVARQRARKSRCSPRRACFTSSRAAGHQWSHCCTPRPNAVRRGSVRFWS